MMTPYKLIRKPPWGVGLAMLAFTTPALAAPPGDLAFGAYDPPGQFSSDGEVAIEHLFLPWEDVFLGSLYDADTYAKERNRELLVTIEPWTWTRDIRNTPEFLINGIRTGLYDSNMSAICAVLDELDSDITVRWAQEMEDESGQFIWSDWEPTIYVDAFQRMINVCRAVAPDVQVMWSPLGHEGLEDYYPGDDYVDVVGLSVFGLQAWEREQLGDEQEFLDIFTPRYERVKGFGKPVMVAELGYVGDADYVSRWENSVRQDYPQFPQLTSVVYFNQQEVHPWPDGYGLPNWIVTERVLGQ
ncbi:beta-mannanase [Actibacterium atlanticum]|uniref:Beta-mannanase n=1 Tax=Actibacterium atlanticum TaxID=1461693 RepID=A0A058ZI46_9RHOB|nr:glycosyl hydrolase [Actibacterium atlanticum]KCV80877.1 beta-mannanase [Actibacterium atlanticum]